MVSSVHAFAQSPIGKYFVVLPGRSASRPRVILILDRLKYLKSEARLESVVSRESSFMFNNLILLASCFAVLWGTLFPVISEAVTGEKISVDAPFFNRINVPIGLVLLLLTGVGPLIAWRRSSLESLRRAFFWPTIAALRADDRRWRLRASMQHPYALVSFGLCMFVTATIVSEFWKGASAIRAKSGVGFDPGRHRADASQHAPLRRLPGPHGHRVHVHRIYRRGVQSGRHQGSDARRQLRSGALRPPCYRTCESGENDNYAWQRLTVEASRGSASSLGTLYPERRLYKASQQPTSEVSIRRRLNEDLYVNFAGLSADNQRAVIQAYIFPLVSWIWIGFWVLAIGTIVCLIPSKVRLSYARTQVVGVAEKHATVPK